MTTVDFSAWTCPVPLRDTPTVVMGHGGGGAMSAELVEQLFLPAFGKECTPRNPLGATMVSSEGACAAYYAYRRLDLVGADS